MARKQKNKSSSKGGSRKWETSEANLVEEEELDDWRMKSPKSIIKNEAKYNGDIDVDDVIEANGKSDGKQKSWFWQRKKSGDKADAEADLAVQQFSTCIQQLSQHYAQRHNTYTHLVHIYVCALCGIALETHRHMALCCVDITHAWN